ncbi:hypothetical protein B0H10DRAFT_2250363 [Mycena sp. CBHHK59/15]|nr:hypothetical protein B0H10DRAFT_2250363 [Mycena sp. CBHHK59/15]
MVSCGPVVATKNLPNEQILMTIWGYQSLMIICEAAAPNQMNASFNVDHEINTPILNFNSETNMLPHRFYPNALRCQLEHTHAPQELLPDFHADASASISCISPHRLERAVHPGFAPFPFAASFTEVKSPACKHMTVQVPSTAAGPVGLVAHATASSDVHKRSALQTRSMAHASLESWPPFACATLVLGSWLGDVLNWAVDV